MPQPRIIEHRMKPVAIANALPQTTKNWQSANVGSVNGNTVRVRTMKDMAAPWHAHPDGDELFYVLRGTVFIDTDTETHKLNEQDMLVVPSGVRHRARAEGEVMLLVVDNFEA
jgi:mannose-6-phosphate isomerase-like protein (cupin superfamily)